MTDTDCVKVGYDVTEDCATEVIATYEDGVYTVQSILQVRQ